ncbi:MAG: hypothetical protein ACPGLV_05025 [Bacteroidia bacterium]
MKHILMAFFVGLLCNSILAQTVEKSVAKVISSKAAKGNLYHYELNDKSGQFELTYLLKTKKKTLEIETYYFDKSTLEFVESKAEEIDKNNNRFSAQKRVEGDKILRIFPHIASGQVQIQIGHIEYDYVNRAVIRHFIKESQVKPKGDDGEKLVYVHHRTEEANKNTITMWNESYKLNVGDVQVFAIQAEEPSYTKFASLVFDAKTLAKKHFENIELPYSYIPVTADNLPNGDIAIVLKPVVKKDFPKWEKSQKIVAKFKLAPNYKYRYLQISPKGKLVQNVLFDVKEPESGWTMNMDIVPTSTDGEVLIAATMKPLKLLAPPLAKIFGARPIYPEQKDIGIGVIPEYFMVAKISNGKQVFSKTCAANELIQNVVLPEGLSAGKPESMKKYFRYQAFFAQDAHSIKGKTLLIAQRVNYNSHIIQLDESGNIETNYILSPAKKLVLSDKTSLVKNANGEAFMLFYQQPNEKDESSEKQLAALMNRQGFTLKVNVATKQLGKMINITPAANLDPYDGIYIENANSFITLGNGRKKEIVLSRISLK